MLGDELLVGCKEGIIEYEFIEHSSCSRPFYRLKLGCLTWPGDGLGNRGTPYDRIFIALRGKGTVNRPTYLCFYTIGRVKVGATTTAEFHLKQSA